MLRKIFLGHQNSFMESRNSWARHLEMNFEINSAAVVVSVFAWDHILQKLTLSFICPTPLVDVLQNVELIKQNVCEKDIVVGALSLFIHSPAALSDKWWSSVCGVKRRLVAVASCDVDSTSRPAQRLCLSPQVSINCGVQCLLGATFADEGNHSHKEFPFCQITSSHFGNYFSSKLQRVKLIPVMHRKFLRSNFRRTVFYLSSPYRIEWYRCEAQGT